MDTTPPCSDPFAPNFQPLQGIHILSLALNLPGPAALMRCRRLGAHCSKLEPLPAANQSSADAMHRYSQQAYEQLHDGVVLLQANLKSEQGQQLLHQQLAKTDVLLTSFRPSALHKLGLSWAHLQAHYPQLCMVRIFGSTALNEMDHSGHDLTYQAQAGLVHSEQMPSTLFADMTGAIMASEAVMQCLLVRVKKNQGHCIDIGLAQAAQWLALPRQWKMTTPAGIVGGAHAGYRIYPCLDGWVAIAALEPHFAVRVCHLVGIDLINSDTPDMYSQQMHKRIAAFFSQKNCDQISAMAGQSDIPLQVIGGKYK